MRMHKYRNKYRLGSTRLQKWNYSWNASYFITICTFRRISYFGRIESGKMQMKESGEIAEKLWYEIPQHFPNLYLSAFIVMPNHVHGIITINKPWGMDDETRDNKKDNIGVNVETRHALSLQQQNQQNENQLIKPQIPGEKRFQNQGRNTISSIIGGYKSAVSRQVHSLGREFKWQNRFWDHKINSDEEFVRIKKYIIANPDNWINDDFFK